MMEPDKPAPDAPPPESAPDGADVESGPARALTLHLLRMLETRMDAAGIALSTEVQSFSSRMQLKIVAAAALFIAIWGGIVLLAVALPDPYRIPVLSAVVLAFAGGAVWAQLASKRRVSPDDVGSMRWFLDGLKQDLEVLSRSLNRRHEPVSDIHRNPPNDLAA
jgi:uncharacterized membrane protein YqjE